MVDISRFYDRVKDTTTTTGTGNVTLSGSAPSGFITFGSVFASTDSVPYAIDDGAGNWEVGIGILSAPTTLQRTTVLSSSNANALVNFGAGSKTVWCDLPASNIEDYERAARRGRQFAAGM
jgi:hypothetical protein